MYRTVRLAGMANNNEIDAVVVAENGGVFLLDIEKPPVLNEPNQ